MVTDGIVKIHVHFIYIYNSTGVEPESSGKDVSPVTTTSSWASLSELHVTVHVLFSASARPTGQLAGRGAEVTWRVSDWSTGVGC